MQVLAGCLLGLAVGVGAWVAADWLVAHRQARPEDGAPSAEATAPWQLRGALFLPSAISGAVLALVGAYAGWRASSLGVTVIAVLLTGILEAISIVDLRVRRIPNVLAGAVLGLALIQALWLGWPTPPAAALGLAAGGGVFILLAVVSRGAMGAGDIKLAGVLGAMLGFPDILPAMLAGVLLGGLAALWLLATHRAGRRDPMAYGPYLALGAWLVWAWATGLWP